MQCCLNMFGITLHRSNPMQCCLSGSKWHCIRKNPVQCYLGTTATCQNSSQCYLWGSRQHCKQKIMCNVVLILLVQYCTEKTLYKQHSQEKILAIHAMLSEEHLVTLFTCVNLHCHSHQKKYKVILSLLWKLTETKTGTAECVN